MELIKRSVTEYLKDGEYYKDAHDWYHKKYIFPIFERSIITIILAFISLLACGLCLNLYALLPLKKKLEYISYVSDALGKSTSIIPATTIPGKPLESIAYLLVKNYVIQRERYDYDEIKKQLIFLKNNSTRIVFKDFYDNLSLSNPNSIIFQFKKNTRRYINPINFQFVSDSNIIITFNARAINDRNEIVEDKILEANVSFEIDKIKPGSIPGTRFGFIVTDYKLKEIKDNRKSD